MVADVDSVNRFFLIAAGLIVTAGLVMIGFRMSDLGKAAAGHLVDEMAAFESDMESGEILRYDGRVVSGSDVVNFIKKHLSDCSVGQIPDFEIKVCSDTITIHKDNRSMKDMMNFSHPAYINPTGRYLGEVTRNKNGVIEMVIFTQR